MSDAGLMCYLPVHNSWRYESVVLTKRIAGKRMNEKKIKLLCSNVPIPLHDLKVKVTVLDVWCLSFKTFFGFCKGFQKCFRMEKRDFRRAVLSGDRSYSGCNLTDP